MIAGAVASTKVRAANGVASGIVRVGWRQLVSDFADGVEGGGGSRPQALDRTARYELSPISKNVDDCRLMRKPMRYGVIRRSVRHEYYVTVTY
jgi:hypothetical protein